MINTFALIESNIKSKSYYGKNPYGFSNSKNIKVCKKILKKHPSYDLILASINSKWVRKDFVKKIIIKNKNRMLKAIYNGNAVSHFSPSSTPYIKGSIISLKKIRKIKIDSVKHKKSTILLNKCQIKWF
jgi:hypothetical protein